MEKSNMNILHNIFICSLQKKKKKENRVYLELNKDK